MTLWPNQGTDSGVDWEAYRRKTARPGSWQIENEGSCDSEETVIEPPRRQLRSRPVE